MPWRPGATTVVLLLAGGLAGLASARASALSTPTPTEVVAVRRAAAKSATRGNMGDDVADARADVAVESGRCAGKTRIERSKGGS